MSGTSADGIDAALVSIEGHGLGTKVTLVDSLSLDYEKDFKARLIAVAGGGSTTTCEISALNFLLGELFADAAEALWKRNVDICPRIDFVASHGHTLWHEPRGVDYFGRNVRSTLQLGEFSCISERLGCPVVGDFRVRDVAAGGQGAPLVPFTEYILYANDEKDIAIQNIGGIGHLPQNLACIRFITLGPALIDAASLCDSFRTIPRQRLPVGDHDFTLMQFVHQSDRNDVELDIVIIIAARLQNLQAALDRQSRRNNEHILCKALVLRISYLIADHPCDQHSHDGRFSAAGTKLGT